MRGEMRNYWTDVESDFRFLRGENPSFKKIVAAYIFNPGFKASSILRLQMFVCNRGWHRLAQMLSNYNLMKTGAEFCVGVRIGAPFLIRHPSGIVVGGGVVIGDFCTILQGVTLGRVDLSDKSASKDPKIGSYVVFGAYSAALGDITIVDNTIIGAHSVLLESALNQGTYVGTPAKLLNRMSIDE